MGLWLVGSQFHRAAQLFHGRLEVALHFVGLPKMDMRHRQFRTKLDDLAEMGDRFLDLPLAQQHLRQHALRLGTPGIRLHCLIESRARRDQIAPLQSRNPALIISCPRIDRRLCLR